MKYTIILDTYILLGIYNIYGLIRARGLFTKFMLRMKESEREE